MKTRFVACMAAWVVEVVAVAVVEAAEAKGQEAAVAARGRLRQRSRVT